MKKIKRFNPLYAIGFIVIPIAVMLILTTIAVTLIKNPGVGNIVSILGAAFVVLWFSVLGGVFYKSKVKQFEKELDDMGFKRNQTFNGKGETVIVDVAGGKIAVIFYWNPFKKYIVSASKVEKAWVFGHEFDSRRLHQKEKPPARRFSFLYFYLFSLLSSLLSTVLRRLFQIKDKREK